MHNAPGADSAEGRPKASSFRRLGVPAVALSLALGAAQLAAAAPSEAATASTSTRVAIGKAPTLPHGAVAAIAATPASSSKLDLDFELNTGKSAALEAYANDVANRESPYYHQYLTSAQVAQDFGASQAQISAVEAQLRTEGVTPDGVIGDGAIIHATATVAQAEKAFGVTIKGYAAAGRHFYANTTAPTFASSVAGDISGVVGLDDTAYATPQYVSTGHTALIPASDKSGATVAPQAGVGTPCSNIKKVLTGYTDGQQYYTDDALANIYGISGVPSNGSGVTVAVIEFEPFDITGVDDMLSCYGSNAPVSESPVDGGPSGTANMDQNVGVESALDIENIGVLAPGASIVDYAGPTEASPSQTVDTLNDAVSGPAKVISDSWLQCEPDSDSAALSSENTIFSDAATEGKTVLAASGDGGSAGCYFDSNGSTISVDDPASQPFVTGVGGTTMTGLTADNPQSVWNWGSSYGGATGGGLSSVWPQPSYQDGDDATGYSEHCATASTTGCREVPDVSALGDPDDGYVLEEYWSNGTLSGEALTIEGGTSGAAPLWAAIIAIADSSSECATNGPAGFINPALYTAGNSMSRFSVFRGITEGNNNNSYYSGSSGYGFSASAGYNMAAGWGTPLAPGVLATVCQGSVVSPASYYVPDGPTRILDTGTGVGHSGAVAPQSSISLQVAGASLSGVPSTGVTAVVINFTIAGPTQRGIGIVYPDGSAVPATSNIDWMPGNPPLPNLVIVPLGSDGKIDFFNGSTGTVQFLADIQGYFTTSKSAASASTYTAVGPARAMDTRYGTGGVPKAQVTMNHPISLQVGGTTLPSTSIKIPTGITGVAMNVTVAGATSNGYLTVYPNETSAGTKVTTPPGTSNLNFATKQIIPNMVIVPVGPDGKVDFAVGSNGGTDVIADIAGYFTAGTSGSVFHATGPDRIMDTRVALGSSSTLPVGNGATKNLTIPPSATAIVANLTITQPTSNGLITAFPVGGTVPGTSNVNYAPGGTSENLALIPSKSGVSFFNGSKGTVHLITDLSGYFSAS